MGHTFNQELSVAQHLGTGIAVHSQMAKMFKTGQQLYLAPTNNLVLVQQ
jgi:hypothetical protein